MRTHHRYFIGLLGLIILASCGGPAPESIDQAPNILWIYVEDISPDLGCYGNELAHTPRLNELASQSRLFTNVVTPAPVCSPARSAIITGVMHTTLGLHNHHSSRTESAAIELPDSISTIPELFKAAGYFTYNHGKDDYNFDYQRDDLYWGDYTVHPLYGMSGVEVNWTDRPDPDMPFFGQIQLRGGKHVFKPEFSELIEYPIDRSSVMLPPYYPQDSILVEEWARYLETHEVTDREVGNILDKLAADGVLNNTVVFFFADHGMRALRHKQFLYEGGLKVPFIMADFTGRWIPESSVDTNLVSLLDISATSLSIAGIELPDYLDGKDLTAENYQPHSHLISGRDRCDFTIDRIRSVHSGEYKYIRNFLTDRPILQPNYRDEWESTIRFRELYQQGQLNDLQSRIFREPRIAEEFYHLESDPHETINLVDSAAYQDALNHHRRLLETWITATDDQGQYAEDPEGLKYMLGIWGEQAVNPEYQELREEFPDLGGSLYEKRFDKPRLISHRE